MDTTTILSLAQENVISLWGILLFWAPLAFCAFGYTIRTAANVRKDMVDRTACEAALARGEHASYVPTDTIGTLIGRGIATICPLVNLWAALFDLGPDIFGTFFKHLGEVFNQPLVPKRK